MNKNKKLPNLFIIGAPKCGTTSLSRYLSEHPAVFICAPKEPYYLADDFPRMRAELSGIDSWEKYLELFRLATAGQRVRGEASTVYLYSLPALQHIQRISPQAKIILMLRSPVQQVHAFHSHLLRLEFEDEPDFERAWRLQDLRQKGENIPRHCPDAKLLQYQRLGMLGEHTQRVLTIFDPPQVKVILVDDFSQAPRATYQDVLQFLNLEDDGREHFPKLNVNARYRSPRLARWFIKIRQQRFYRYLAGAWRGRIAVHPYRWFQRLNREEVKRRPLSNQFQSELAEVFAEDVHRLSQLLDRDLSGWLQVSDG